MKSIRLHDYGSFEQLRLEDIPVPDIKDDQILVKVYAASVNHLDIKKASGAMKEKMPLILPWTPGHDFAGIVEKVGSKVTIFKKGDKVYGNCMGGSYAEYLAADIDKTIIMPQSLSFTEACTVPHVGETAWQALYTHGQLKNGQTVLIHGGAGAVGGFAVQFAHNTGAKVLTTALAEDLEYVRSIGADGAIDFKTQDFTEIFKDVDLVLLLVGGDTEEKSYSVMKEGSRLVSTVGLNHPETAKKKNISATAMVIEQSGDDLSEITRLINEGKVKTDVGEVYPLDDTVTSWKALSGDKSVKKPGRGKLVLEIHKQ